MRFLTTSLLFLLLLSGCAVSTIKGLPETETQIETFSNPYFSNPTTDYVYKAKIHAFKNVFGGILIIKKIKENNHRIVFTTNFGNKIFDFELDNNQVTTHFVLKELDRKIIINTLQRDFKTLIQEHHPVLKTYDNGENLIYQSKSIKRFNHFEVSKKSGTLTKITHTSRSKEKVIITFSKTENYLARHIIIDHKNAPIKIALDYLNSN